MRFRLSLLLIAGVVAGILLFTSFQKVSGSPSPKKRKGSSSSKSSSSQSASRPSSPSSGRRPSSDRRPSSGSSKPKSSKYKPKNSKVSKKSFAKKHWKKALAFGAGAYIGYKVTKKFKKGFKPFHFGGLDYDFDDWDGYARIDGWVCRNDQDCTWMDRNLGCDDREFSITLINAHWPWKADLSGRCACQAAYFFDNGSCRFQQRQDSNFGSLATLAGWIIAVIVIAIIIGCCCCVGLVCYFMKR